MESSSFEHHPFVRPKRPRSTFLSNFEQRTTELVRCQLFRTSITRTGPDGARYHGCVITLGVDPGTAICGFGVVDFDGGSLRLVEAGCIRTDATETDAARLEQLHAAALTKLKEFDFNLRKKAGSDNSQLSLSGSEEVPAGFRQQIEEYYRKLAQRGTK